MYLDDQNLCIQTSSSFVYGAVPIGASIYVVGDLDTGQYMHTHTELYCRLWLGLFLSIRFHHVFWAGTAENVLLTITVTIKHNISSL